MLVLEVENIYKKKENCKANAPLIVGCKAEQGELMYLKTYGRPFEKCAEQLEEGQVCCYYLKIMHTYVI